MIWEKTMLRPVAALLASMLSVVLVLSTSEDVEASNCKGRVPDPVGDVCWSCLMPIKVAGVRMSDEGVSDPDTDAPAVCACQSGPVLRPGFNLTFWEPVRMAEVVREPYCFPTLGGISMDASGMPSAPAHGRSASRGIAHEGKTTGDGFSTSPTHTAFYQAHWYHTPWLFVLQVLLDTTCLENALKTPPTTWPTSPRSTPSGTMPWPPLSSRPSRPCLPSPLRLQPARLTALPQP